MKETIKMKKTNDANKRLVKTLNELFGKELYEVNEEWHDGKMYLTEIREIKKETI